MVSYLEMKRNYYSLLPIFFLFILCCMLMAEINANKMLMLMNVDVLLRGTYFFIDYMPHETIFRVHVVNLNASYPHYLLYLELFFIKYLGVCPVGNI